jgi:chromosome segregation protein
MEQLPLMPSELNAPEGTIRALEVVDCAPEHERLRNYLLADVCLCDSLATALLLWARNPGQRTFVSEDGEVVDKEGIVSGGQLGGVGDGLLHKRRELQELAETVQGLEARLHLLTQQVQILGVRVQAADTQQKRLVHEEREEELSQLRLERDVTRLSEELGRIAQRDQVLVQELEALQNALNDVLREERDSRDAVAAGEGEQTEREARLRSLQAALLEARGRAEAVQAEVTKAKVSNARRWRCGARSWWPRSPPARSATRSSRPARRWRRKSCSSCSPTEPRCATSWAGRARSTRPRKSGCAAATKR